MRTANFSGGKAFKVFIDLKGYGHCIYLLLIESLIVIPPGKRRPTLGFPVKLKVKMKRNEFCTNPQQKNALVPNIQSEI